MQGKRIMDYQKGTAELQEERDEARGEMRRYKALYYHGADVMLNYMVDNVRLRGALDRVRAISNNTPNSYQAEIAAITIATAALGLDSTE